MPDNPVDVNIVSFVLTFQNEKLGLSASTGIGVKSTLCSFSCDLKKQISKIVGIMSSSDWKQIQSQSVCSATF